MTAWTNKKLRINLNSIEKNGDLADCTIIKNNQESYIIGAHLSKIINESTPAKENTNIFNQSLDSSPVTIKKRAVDSPELQ